MKFTFRLILFVFSFSTFVGCKKSENLNVKQSSNTENAIEYASGLSINKYEGYSVVSVSNPWPEANKNFTYILKEKNGSIPDSLQKYTIISVPLKSIVVTSTTIIPFLEMLGVEKSLVGFPHTDYISSEKTRKLIDAGTVKNIGQN